MPLNVNEAEYKLQKCRRILCSRWQLLECSLTSYKAGTMVGTSSFDPTELAKLPKGYLQQDIGDRLIITASVFIVLQTIFVTLFYISRHLTKTLNGLECWLFMPVGYILTTVLCVCGICKYATRRYPAFAHRVTSVSVKCGGSGRHVEAVLLQDPQMVINRNKIDKVVEFVYIEAIAGTKLAILCLYLRIFSTRSYRIATYLVGALIILTVIGAHICSLVICSPIAFQWNPTIPGGHCGNLMLAYQMWCIPNIATDVMMLVLPLPAIFKLRIDMAVKIGLTITFLTGSG